MLVLTRKAGQIVTLFPHPALAGAANVGEVFGAQGVGIYIGKIGRGGVRLGFEAHPGLVVWRAERDISNKFESGVRDARRFKWE